MSELEDIKQRAAKRREEWTNILRTDNRRCPDGDRETSELESIDSWCKPVEADLDHAIAIAEKWEAQCEEVVAASQGVKARLEEERDQAVRKLSLAKAAASVEQAIKWRDERDQARAAVEQLHNDVGTLTEEVNRARETLRWYRESLMLKIHPAVKEGQALLGRTFREESSYRNDNTDQ